MTSNHRTPADRYERTRRELVAATTARQQGDQEPQITFSRDAWNYVTGLLIEKLAETPAAATVDDRMAAALTAIALIEQPDNDELSAELLPDNLPDTQRILATAVIAAHLLASQLALHLEIDRAQVIDVLRRDIAACFNPKEDDQ